MENFASAIDLFTSPLGPPLTLALGAFVVWVAGLWIRHSGVQTGIALLFWTTAFWLTIGLRLVPVVPIYSRPWQPTALAGTHLFWVGDGWNWYVSCLILLIGGVAILLSGFGGQYVQPPDEPVDRRTTAVLVSHLGILSTALLFVGSGNLLTVTITWVVMDVLVLVRNAVAPFSQDEDEFVSLDSGVPTRRTRSVPLIDQAQGLSLIGALLLLIGLLPAGQLGPGQPLQGGNLPSETIFLMLVAAAIRAGAYPFHLWLLPANTLRLRLPDRFVDHLVPALCGLWLLGWSSGLGGAEMLVQPWLVTFVLLTLLGSAIAAYTATQKPGHTTFVLVTSAGLASLTSILSENQGPAALIWPTTTFALGGGLWLVGERVWREWGWQIPVSVGALALLGVPFSPGFLTQSSIARLLSGDFSGTLVLPVFIVYLIAQTVYVSSLLRSWGVRERRAVGLASPVIWRLLAASVILAVPLVVTGIFPQTMVAIAGVGDAIPGNVGDPPSAVASTPVWLTLGLPLIAGIGLAILRPVVWPYFGHWPDRISHFAGLEWLSNVLEWTIESATLLWDTSLNIVEGSGSVGWLIAFIALSIFLLG